MSIDPNLYQNESTNVIHGKLKRLVRLIVKCVQNFKDNPREECYEQINEIVSIADTCSSRSYRLTLVCYDLVYKLYTQFSDLPKCLSILLKWKIICWAHSDFYNLLTYNKKLGTLYLNTRKYDKALKYLKRFLIYTWALNN